MTQEEHAALAGRSAGVFTTAFPHFTRGDVPSLPHDFHDVSHGDDASPRFWSPRRGVTLWVQHPDPGQRDDHVYAGRYLVQVGRDEDWARIQTEPVTLFQGDDWAALLAGLPAPRNGWVCPRCETLYAGEDSQAHAGAGVCGTCHEQELGRITMQSEHGVQWWRVVWTGERLPIAFRAHEDAARLRRQLLDGDAKGTR